MCKKIELEKNCWYLLIANGKEYAFKWDGYNWADSLFGQIPESVSKSMHVAGRLTLGGS